MKKPKSMNRLRFLVLSCLITTNLLVHAQPLTDYVNPFIGTSGHGHTFPGATTPFGMVQLSPDTGIKGWDWCGGYYYSDSSIMGFSHTHISGTGVEDLADILVMPTVGEVIIIPGSKETPDEGYRSRFSHSTEVAKPGYYKVLLEDYNIQAELTATAHCGMHQYTFPKSDESNIIVDLYHGLESYVMEANITVEDNQTIVGTRISSGWAHIQPIYFVMKFSKPFEEFATGIEAGDTRMIWGRKEVRNSWRSEANTKAVVRFKTVINEKIVVKVGVSMTSVENARKNLEAEISGWDFEAVKEQARKQWEGQLAKIVVEGTEKDKEIFYTSIYHAMICPNNIADLDGSFIGPDNRLDKAADKEYYSTFSLWDTYRATHPFFTMTVPDKVSKMINSMLLHYQKWGYLPMWSLWGQETHTMVGNHAIPVIVDAYFKCIRNFDVELAYKAIKVSSTRDHYASEFSLIDKYGYVPSDRVNSVSMLLEIAYDDWCVAQMAKDLGKIDDYEFFIKRSENYKNVYDKSTGFMRGKNRDGKWTTPFDPSMLVRRGDYTEGNAWQYLWLVQHDVPGLMELVGGPEVFSKRLEELFTTKHSFGKDAGDVGDATGFIGEYAHGNEPSHHIAYLFNYAGKPWMTQKYVKEIFDTIYNNTPEGLSGNEDCGQMSAWYILSAMGFYPVNPANGVYMIGTPKFDKVTFTSPEGKIFTITAKNRTDKNFYIKSVKLNGENWNHSYIKHSDLMSGGSLEFIMSDKPNMKWANEVIK